MRPEVESDRHHVPSVGRVAVRRKYVSKIYG